MKSWCALLLAALFLCSANLSVSAQGGIVIRKKTETTPKAAKAPKEAAQALVVIESEDGQQHRLELKPESKRQVIDLGNGKKAIVIIETDSGDGDEVVVFGDQDFDQWAKTQVRSFEVELDDVTKTEAEDGEAFECIIDCEEGDADCEDLCEMECEVDIDCEMDDMGGMLSGILGGMSHQDMQALAPLAGQFLSQIDMGEYGPMIGKLMENVEIDFEKGDLKLKGQNLNLQALLKAHGHDGNHQAIWSSSAPSIDVEIADATCECDCACKCCKKGSCPNGAKAGGKVFFGKAAPKPGEARKEVIIRRHGDAKAPKRAFSFSAPTVKRRVVVSPHDHDASHDHGDAHEHSKEHVIRLHPGPQAPKKPILRRRALQQLPTEIPHDAKGRIFKWKQAEEGQNLDHIEDRIERLADEMKALQKELRSLKKKI